MHLQLPGLSQASDKRWALCHGKILQKTVHLEEGPQEKEVGCRGPFAPQIWYRHIHLGRGNGSQCPSWVVILDGTFHPYHENQSELSYYSLVHTHHASLGMQALSPFEGF